MIRYNRMIIAVLAAAMLSACSAKSDAPATETVGAVTQPETGQPVIQLQEETSSAPELTDFENMPVAGTGSGLLKEAEKTAETKVSAETRPAEEKEPVKVYSVEAFERTMYATAFVNVRSSYTTQSDVLTSLSPGQKVRVTGRSANGWMRIIYNGRDAYVYQKYLNDSVPTSKNGTGVKQPESHPAATAYPGNVAEDPAKSPGEVPIVEPIPIMTAPGQNSSSEIPGSSAAEYGPGVVSPGGGNSWSEPGTPGYGPGMN